MIDLITLLSVYALGGRLLWEAWKMIRREFKDQKIKMVARG